MIVSVWLTNKLALLWRFFWCYLATHTVHKYCWLQMASRRRQAAKLPLSGDPPVASRPKRARKPTLRARQQADNVRGDTQDGLSETPLMEDSIQVTQQRAGGLDTDGSPVAGAAVTQQCAGNIRVGQASQLRAGGLASPGAASAPGADINTTLLLQLVGQMQSVQGTLMSHQAAIERLTRAETSSSEPQPSSSAESADNQPAPGHQLSNAQPSGVQSSGVQPSSTNPGEVETPLQVGVPGLQQPEPEPEPRKMMTAGMPLGHSLPQKVKDDIWADKYIDLAVLLYPDTTVSYGVQLSGEVGDGQEVPGELKFTPHKKRITTINEWSKAFSTYISVYIQKPGREGLATELLTYMAEVQSIAEDGLDWAMYDEQYRRERASSKAPFSWATVNQTLHNKIMRKRPITVVSPTPSRASAFSSPNPNLSGPPGRKNFRNQAGGIPTGFCFAFHSPGKYCSKSPCTYKHTCFKCKGGKSHPQFLCKIKNDRQRQPANTDKSWMPSRAPVGLWYQLGKHSLEWVQIRFYFALWKGRRKYWVKKPSVCWSKFRCH